MIEPVPLPPRLRSLWIAGRVALGANPRLSFFYVALGPLGWVPSALSALWMKWLVDAVLAHDAGAATRASVGLALTWSLGYVIGGFQQRFRRFVEDDAGKALHGRLFSLVIGLPSLDHVERPIYQDRFALLREQSWMLSEVMEPVVEATGATVRVAFAIVLLVQIHPALGLLPLFAVASFVATTLANRIQKNAAERTAELRRHELDLYLLGTEPGPAKELRVFGLETDLLRRHDDTFRTAFRVLRRSDWKSLGLLGGGWLVFAAGFVASIAFVALGATRGVATVGEVLMTLVLANRMNENVAMLVDTYGWALGYGQAAQRFAWIVELDRDDRRARAHAVAPPESLRHGLRVENVSFRYPGSETWILQDVSLDLPAGRVVAIVGENGAGKTTLTKLLLRFYEPTSGRITVDSVDLASVDPDRWRERCTGAFQDFHRFELLLRQTVGIGDLAQIEDEGLVRRAIDRAGGSALAESPGLDAQLGVSWPNGMDLSTGQWQKLALGRSLMRETPLFVVYDEPTSALDAPTEHELFELVAHESAAARARGAVTLLISHRFSTVRMADEIVVLDNGRVVEHGSHEELVSAGGLYAELYAIQAKAYR